MITVAVLVFSALCGVTTYAKREFPPWFMFGAGTSAYQIEGAWNVSDKGESVWDRFVYEDPSRITDGTNGDIACDSYHLWPRDVEMAKELGLQFYRFSISWSRLLPTGHSNKISKDGLRYYSDLIDALLENGIQPMVTLFHFDLPQSIQDLGGWTNQFIIKTFVSYARIVLTEFSPKVKYWITINEPQILCGLGYTSGDMAPGIKEPVFAPYLCQTLVLEVHAEVYRMFHDEFKGLYGGKMSLANNLIPLSPNSSKDATLTKLATDFMFLDLVTSAMIMRTGDDSERRVVISLSEASIAMFFNRIGRYTDPIYSMDGGYPDSSVKLMRDVSAKEGYEESRMPQLTAEQIVKIRGTFDFFALNYYTCSNVRRAKPSEEVPDVIFKGNKILNAIIQPDPSRGITAGGLAICPEALRPLLSWIKTNYGDIEIIITENGIANKGSNLKDKDRIDFMYEHLEQIWLSINEDNVNVTGYTIWSLMDNFEWMSGESMRFGLYEVDFKSPIRTRTPRLSAKYYKKLIASRSLDVYYNHKKP